MAKGAKMKKIEVWSCEIASSQYNEEETILVQASSPATASKRALKIAKTNGYFDGYSKREKQSLYVRSASFKSYVYLT